MGNYKKLLEKSIGKRQTQRKIEYENHFFFSIKYEEKKDVNIAVSYFCHVRRVVGDVELCPGQPQPRLHLHLHDRVHPQDVRPAPGMEIYDL